MGMMGVFIHLLLSARQRGMEEDAWSILSRKQNVFRQWQNTASGQCCSWCEPGVTPHCNISAIQYCFVCRCNISSIKSIYVVMTRQPGRGTYKRRPAFHGSDRCFLKWTRSDVELDCCFVDTPKRWYHGNQYFLGWQVTCTICTFLPFSNDHP